jgi:hypothetical protein
MAGLVPAIPLRDAPLCPINRDHRDKPGDDKQSMPQVTLRPYSAADEDAAIELWRVKTDPQYLIL